MSRHILVGMVSGMYLLSIFLSQSAHANEDYSWINDATISVKSINDADRPRCDSSVEVINFEILVSQQVDTYTTACIYHSKSFQLAKYTNKYQRYEIAMRIGEDKYFRVLRGVDNPNEVVPIPNSDELFFRTRSGAFISSLKSIDVGTDLKIYENLLNGTAASYYIEQDSYDSWLSYISDDNQVKNLRVSSAVSSSNGKFVFVLAPDIGHIVLNLEDRTARLVNRVIVPGYAGGIYAPETASITNDGELGLISGPLETIDLNECGIFLNKSNTEMALKNILNPENYCKKVRNYTQDIYQYAKYYGYGLDYRWVNNSFRFTVSPLPGTNDARMYGLYEVTLSNPRAQVKSTSYIALGDSYSSGEGDASRLNDGSSFYIKGTQAPGECHISSRSYPFLIAKLNQVGEEQMKSIACSGAQMGRDYYGQSSDYYGQHGFLKGLSETDISTKRVEALKSFTPGMVKQIKFVEEHKPKVVTLTGGGNDVGFARLLTYCAMPNGMGAAVNTCDQAVPNTLLRSMLGDAIQSQYKTTLELIAALKAASDKTTVYVIGYPSFVSDGRTSCANAGFLNQREREVINQSVAYMNTVLKTAASAGGAKFIDIETSLVGGRLCEGSEFVTGPVDVAGFDIIDRKQEMFHPNSAGHQQMAQVIAAKGFKVQESDNPAPASAVVPTKPKVFGSGKYVPTFQEKMTTDLAVAAHSYVWMSIAPGYFAANKPVKLTIYSQPDTLGTLVAGSNGSVSGKLSLSGRVSPGYHMLVAEGTSPIGESTRLYQFVEVTSGRVNDRDGDGILDDQDRCQYVNFWIDEDGGNDICTTHHKPGLGLGNGYGHIISNGSHAGHKNIDVSQSMFSLD